MRRTPNRGTASLQAYFFCLILFFVGRAQAQGLDDFSAAQARDDERLLVEAVEHMSEGELDDALQRLEVLLERNPKFRLAQLIYADLLTGKAGSLDKFGALPNAPLEDIAALRDEAKARLARHRYAPSGEALPAELLKLSDSQRLAVVVDVALSRLYLFRQEDGVLRSVGDFYVSTGKNGPLKIREGDQKTPLGVYFITGRIAPDRLPDFYGTGALPVNYPNEWDRLLGRTGYGIWIHGVPTDTYSRPPRASDGCMALANDDMSLLLQNLGAIDTPVVITNGVEWIEPQEMAARRGAFLAALDQWRRDWESRDHDLYARHYGATFRSNDKDYDGWLRYKRGVNTSKRYIRVALSDISVFAYPAEPNMLVANFRQHYQSDRLNKRTRKRQYWRRNEYGQWQIVYEGLAKDRSPASFPYSARSNLSSLGN